MIPYKLLWIDCSGGITVGVFVLGFHGWLAGVYGLPISVLLFVGAANLIYGCYSLTLASRPKPTRVRLLILITANAAWAVVCIGLVLRFFHTATLIGIGVLIAEAVFVGGLAALEWRWRHHLATSV